MGMTGIIGACSYQVAYVDDGQTYTTTVIGGNGDIYQRYTGDDSDPTSITPDFEALAAGTKKPMLRISVMGSDAGLSTEDIAGMIFDNYTEWYVNGEKLVFDSDSLSKGGTWPGCFRKLTAGAGTWHDTDAPHGGLRIEKNLVALSGGSNIWVMAVVALDNGNSASDVIYTQGGTYIQIIKSNGQSCFATIYCDPDESFVLKSDDTDHKKDRVTCKVNCWRGDTKLAGNQIKTVYSMIENGVWVEKSRFPSDNAFLVTRDDIATFGQVKADCYELDGTTLIASDIQAINDASDGYIVLPHPEPADGKIYKTGGPDGITFTPEIRTVNDEAGPDCDFIFTLLDSIGGNHTPASIQGQRLSSYKLGKDAVVAHKGITVNIEAVAK